MDPNCVGGRYPYAPSAHPGVPFLSSQNMVPISCEVNLKKETLRVEPDEENPGKYLVAFTFEAMVAGSISIIFFAKEGESCHLMPMKESLLPPVTDHFQQGFDQKFRQPSGTGIDFSMFEETELFKEGYIEVFPLAVKLEASPINQNGSADGNPGSGATNSQITQAVFEKEKGEYQVRVIRQILWARAMRIRMYGIKHSVCGDFNNDLGKECLICLSKPGDTAVFPCQHLCMCSGCAQDLRFHTTQCPICRCPIESLWQAKNSDGTAN